MGLLGLRRKQSEMKGLLFDSEMLIQGLPVRWRLKDDPKENRFGLIEEADPIYVVIGELDSGVFNSEQYHISQISEFELLGDNS